MYKLYFDGSCIPNPGGQGCYGYILMEGNKVICKGSGIAEEESTNNRAEYWGLIYGLQAARRRGITRITIIGDSAIVINQMTWLYKVNAETLKPLFKKAQELRREFGEVKFKIIDHKNNPAHKLAQEARRA